MKKRKFTSIIVYAVLLVIAVSTGFIGGIWKSFGENVKLNLNFPNMLSIICLILFTLLLERLIVFILSKIKPINHRAATVIAITSNMVKYFAAIVIICEVFALLGVDIVTIVAGLGVIALIVGFGAESLITDVVTGMFILLDNQYNVGDIIEVNGFRGTVTDIGIRTTSVTDPGGNIKIINNSDMKNILNRSEKNSKAVADFSIPYETDIEALEKKIPGMMQAIYEAHTDVMRKEPVYLGVQELGESAVVLRFVVEVGENDIFSVARILNHDLFVNMRKVGVECPFNQLDVHSK